MEVLEQFRQLNLALCDCNMNLTHDETKAISLERSKLVFWHINDPYQQYNMNHSIADMLIVMLGQLAQKYRSKRELIRTATSRQSITNALQEFVAEINLFKEQQQRFLDENRAILSKFRNI